MDRDNPTDLQVESWLKSLGVALLCQWDVLLFLYRHATSLVSAEHIARLLGHPTGDVVAALDHLEALGLVTRSRVDQGVRLYQYAVPADAPGDSFHRLLALADRRAGRLLLSRKLRRGKAPQQDSSPPRLHREEGRAAWLKAI